ncbi:MAG: hypothetical protein R3F48_15330 [Candidatus Zixiibacteriota bacterium]
MESPDQEKNETGTPSVSRPEGFNDQLIQAYRAELERLQEADSEERNGLYVQALELGIDIIRGDV